VRTSCQHGCFENLQLIPLPLHSRSAICGGGRYDKLLSAYGGEDAPCAGFGFGDAVIVELLQERGLLPSPAGGVDDVVAPLDEALRPAAAAAAAALRAAGRRVDLVLEAKKMKWVLKRAQTAGAARLLLLGTDEYAKGCIRVKVLETREEKDVPIADIINV
jgi:histidyl-tRNA synthetase